MTAAVICIFIAMVLYELGVFVIGMFFTRTYFGRLGVFFLTALLSMFIVPVLYPICCSIAKIGGGEPWKE